MPEEPFLLVSLKENESKKLAQVISNDTCRRLLDELSRGNGTETELAKRLNLPISTVHYNLQNLLKARLVNAEEFHYSEKGKEVNHYSLSNKLVIIAPKGATESFREKLKKILPIGAIILGITALIQIFNKMKIFTLTKSAYGMNLAQEKVADTFMTAAPTAERMVESGAGAGGAGAMMKAAINETANQSINKTTELISGQELISQTVTVTRQPFISVQNIALWFFIGALITALLIFLFFGMKKYLKKSKK